MKTFYLVGGLSPSEKYESQWDDYPHILWKKKSSKPPTSYVSISDDSRATPATPLPLRQLLLGCCPAVYAIQTAEEEAAAAMETWIGNGAKEQGR